MTAIVSTCLCMFGCGSGGGGGSAAVRPCQGSGCVETAAGAALDTVSTFGADLADVPGTGAGGGAAATVGPTSVRRLLRVLETSGSELAGVGAADGDGDAAAVCGPCPMGGSRCLTCTEDCCSSTEGSSFSNCGILDHGDGNLLIANGAGSETVAVGGLCEGADIPDDVKITNRFDHFSVAMQDGGRTIGHVNASFAITVDPRGYGCAGADRTESLDGSLDVQSSPDGIDTSARFHGLQVQYDSGGVPCTETVTADGGLEIVDRAQGRRFSEAFHGLQLTRLYQSSGTALVTIDGGVTVDCVGDVRFETQSPMLIPSGERCPIGGRLAITRAGITNCVTFTATGGIDFDDGCDGTTDRSVASCDDTSLAQCG